MVVVFCDIFLFKRGICWYDLYIYVLRKYSFIVVISQVDLFFSSRLSNNEKKLEAVRSGVRAISVSGKKKTTPTKTV